MRVVPLRLACCVRVVCVLFACVCTLQPCCVPGKWPRPYRVEYTGFLPTSAIKRRKARLVLGWGAAWEDLRVLSAVFPRLSAPCSRRRRAQRRLVRARSGARTRGVVVVVVVVLVVLVVLVDVAVLVLVVLVVVAAALQSVLV